MAYLKSNYQCPECGSETLTIIAIEFGGWKVMCGKNGHEIMPIPVTIITIKENNWP